VIGRVLVLLCTAAGSALAAPVGAVATIDRPAAFVGDDVLWQSEVDERRAAAPAASAPDAPDTLIADMIDELLMLRGAQEAHIDASSADIDEALEQIKKQNGIDDGQLEVALKGLHTTRAAYRNELSRQLRLLRFVNVVLWSRVDLRDAEVDREAAARGLKPPLADADRARIRKDLGKVRVEAEKKAWVAARRKATRIVVVP
jgi:parvulin-like peptidyl-prolyl isomerase